MDQMLALEGNEVMLVVRTRPGRAPGVAAYLDNLRLPTVLGTVAGDDTILVLPRSVERIAGLRGQLREILGLARG